MKNKEHFKRRRFSRVSSQVLEWGAKVFHKSERERKIASNILECLPPLPKVINDPSLIVSRM